MQVLRLSDEIAIVTLPGEIFVELGLAIKKASPFEEHMSRISEMVNSALHTPLNADDPEFYLANLTVDQMQPEVEFCFELESTKNQFKGFIDLFFQYQNKYYIIDWKSNDLGDYSEESLRKTVERENYHYQAAIYAYAMKGYLETVVEQPVEEVFGGVYTIILRGIRKKEGILSIIPDFELLKII